MSATPEIVPPPPPDLHDLIGALSRSLAAAHTLASQCRSADGQVIAERKRVEQRLQAALDEVVYLVRR